MLGPDRDDLKDVSILNRLDSFEDSHTTYEADPRHVQILLRELGVIGAKPVSSPGVAQQSFEKKELSAEDTKMYRSLTMRAAYLSMEGRASHGCFCSKIAHIPSWAREGKTHFTLLSVDPAAHSNQ